ncbi:MAG: hypothetical protein ACRDY7_13955 [Acidimicrobiia bacterium]
MRDGSGRAVHLLCAAARFDRQDALTQVLARMDAEGLIRRSVRGRRTYWIEITEAGRRLAGLSPVAGGTQGDGMDESPTPARLRLVNLPPGPASTWGRETANGEESPEVPAPAAPEAAGGATEEAPEVNYEALAEVLLGKSLRSLRAEYESQLVALREELAATRRRIMQLEARIFILEHDKGLEENNRQSHAGSGRGIM